MFRLSIPSLAEDECIEKCIYLDSDLIVEGNIAELFYLDIEGNYLGGVQNINSFFRGNENLRNKPDILTTCYRINAGVLLLNLKEMKAHKIGEKLEKLGHNANYPNNDQDIINSVCYGKIKLLPLKYNMAHDILLFERASALYGVDSVKEAIEKPCVIHYMGHKKPWQYKYDVLADIWWKYVSMQENEILSEYILPFVREYRLPLIKSLKEMLKYKMRKLGVYKYVLHVYLLLKRAKY